MSGPQDSAGPPSADETLALLRHGLALHQQGRAAEAEAAYREVLRRYPNNFDARHLLGLLAHHTGRHAEAVELISAAIAANPKVAGMYVNRGLALGELGRLDEAVADHDRAIALSALAPEAHVARAAALRGLGRLEEAAAGYARTLELRPGLADAHMDHGSTLAALGRPQDALASYDRALALRPDNAGAHFNRANVLKQLGRVDEAIAAYDRAIALQPDFAIAHHNRAICLMLAGELTAGLREYEWRKRCPDVEDPRFGLPDPWSGEEDIAGKTLFIFPELFLGDMIQFCRYAKLAEGRGARVVMAAPASLHALLRTLSPTIELIAKDAQPEAFDRHCALMSLPLAFGTEPSAIPAEIPYLAAEPARVARWKARLGEAGAKVGVCWQGSTLAYSAPLRRAFPLAALVGLARLPGVRLISLQKHDGLEQLSALPPGMAVETLGEDFDAGPDAFLDAAAVMTTCDLVITADTAVAHLAGALGVPTWVALPHAPDWRWRLHGDDSPWYPTVRLFRQEAPGDWTGVFSRIEASLREIANA
ncbi:MAG: tetratricopeptide repeat-containing glycosyltransferase family protein [Phenylobacterium sp.]